MPISLSKSRDVLLAKLADGQDPQPACLVYARPISHRESGISIMDIKRKKELAWLESLDDLDPESKALAERELFSRYRLPVIKEVLYTHVNHGHRHLRVRTDRGERYFNLREPGKNVTYLSSDHLVIRDSMGNRYELESVSALDEESRKRLDMVL